MSVLINQVNLITKGRVNHVDHYVSRRVKLRRVQVGLSLSELASYLDISIQQMQKYEVAQNRISCGKLYIIAKYLNSSIQYFFQDLEDYHQQRLIENIELSILSKESINLMKAFSTVKDPIVRKKIIELIKVIS